MAESACVNCDAPLPPPAPKGGRPRRFCSAECRNRWRYELRLERENPTQRDEERVHAWDVEWYGREGADRRRLAGGVSRRRPTVPPRACIACGRHAIPGTSRCALHSRGWRKSPAMLARASYYNTPQWKARRRRQLQEFPDCARCGTPATIADHIIPRGLGGQDDGPLQSLCTRCHNLKSSSEGGRAAKAKRRRER